MSSSPEASGDAAGVPHRPTVSVVIPTYQEAAAIDRCLAAVQKQTYDVIVEVLVVDGGSTDDTTARARRHPGVRVLENPGRIQSTGLNVGLAGATGDVIVRVDGHCVIAPDYVATCVTTLAATGAAMVGGPMVPEGSTPVQRGIAAAMVSRFGAGPARFHTGGEAGWVDTVYLGAYRRQDALDLGGYSTEVGVNEDAEFAHRMRARGGVWFEPRIRSSYEPRSSMRRLARQFFRYGLSRAATARRHPSSLRLRQLAAPALLLLFAAGPTRKAAAAAYAAGVAGATAIDAGDGPAGRLVFAAAIPIMHLSWAAGFLLGLGGWSPPRPTDR